MNDASFLKALILVTLLCGLAAAAAPGGEGKRPNILLLSVDDLKPALGCYGDQMAITPNIDRLAARGMRFDLAYCNQAVCAPSRHNLMLGARSTSTGMYGLGDQLRRNIPGAVTLTQHFMEHGYRAEALGKILHTGHGNHDDAASWSVPTQREKVVEYLDPRSTDGGKLTREEAYFQNKELGNIGKLPRGAAWEIMDVEDSAYSDGRIADEGIRRLQGAKERGTPFFLALGFVKPHLPFTPPKKYWDMYDRSKFERAEFTTLPEGAPRFAGKVGGEIVQYDPIPVQGDFPPELDRTLMHGYYAGVSYVDAQIGRVIEALDDLGLSDNTIIVLWGDHGWHFGDHGLWTKHTNYEQANRIPLLVIAPGVTKAGQHTKQLAETVDIYPTLVELAGLPKPTTPKGQPLDGVSLVPVLRDGSKRVDDHAYHAYPRGKRIGRAIRTERYRLVEWKEPGQGADAAEIELYDYQADPLETRNLAESQPKVVKELRAILSTHPEAKPN